jgi:hypothetical protein
MPVAMLLRNIQQVTEVIFRFSFSAGKTGRSWESRSFLTGKGFGDNLTWRSPLVCWSAEIRLCAQIPAILTASRLIR